MSVEQEIAEVALEIYEGYRQGDPFIDSLNDTLETADETDDIDALVLAYLMGLFACRLWYVRTRGEFRMAEGQRELTDPGKGKTSKAYEGANARVEELRETTRDEMEKLLTLGYMALYGHDKVNRTLIAPIANSIAEIFELPSAEGVWEGMEDNVYKSMSKRCNDYIKDQKKAGSDDPIPRGKAFLKNIITTLYVQTSEDT